MLARYLRPNFALSPHILGTVHATKTLPFRAPLALCLLGIASLSCSSDAPQPSDPPSPTQTQPQDSAVRSQASRDSEPATKQDGTPRLPTDDKHPPDAGMKPTQDAAAKATKQAAGDVDHNAGPPKNLKLLSKKWTRERVTKYMKQTMSRGLGVKCSFCHDKSDYAADTNRNKRIARDMMRMTRAINRSYIKGKNKVSCYTCHLGKKKP